MRDKVAGVQRQFPRDTDPPRITKIDPDSSPILTLVISAPRSRKEVSLIADQQIKQVLETVQDVGEVGFQGDRRREIQILLNPNRLNAYGLTTDQVRTAVARQNIEVPGGSFTAGPTDISMRTMGRLRNVQDFNKIVLSYRDGSVVRLEDVARVTDSIEEVRSETTLDGESAVSLTIRKQSGTNTVTVVDRVMARLELIQAGAAGRHQGEGRSATSRGSSGSRSRRSSTTCCSAGSWPSLVVFLFIRNLRVTIIAALAIPISIIGTFTVMQALGFTLNNMTMLALSLATGIVIDDAIVVLENIFRYIEEKGVSPKEAAIKATGEIGLAVMATTLSLVVIFLPVAFMTGQVGRYFYSFGITSATAIMLSMFVSFTLTPALCGWWLRSADARQGHARSRSSAGVVRLDGPPVRAHAGVVAGPPPRDAGDLGGRRGVGGRALPLRRQGTGARRRPERVQRERAAAARDELPAEPRVRQADRGGDPRGARRGPACRC